MEKISTNIKERVIIFAKSQGIAIESFLKAINMTYGTFKGKAKQGSLNSDAIVNIYTNYPQINLIWLLTGSGEMLTNIPLIKRLDKIAENDTDIAFLKNTINNQKEVLKSKSETIESQKKTIDSQTELIEMQKDFVTAFKNKQISETDFFKTSWLYKSEETPEIEKKK